MSNAYKKIPLQPLFDPRGFLEKLSEYVRCNPDFAARAYAKAATRMRAESQNYPDKKLALEALAHRLDVLSADASVPEIEFEPQELKEIFADDLGDGLITEYDTLVANIAHAKVDDEHQGRSELASAFYEQHYADEQDRLIAEPVQITPASAKPGVTIFGSEALVQFGGIAGTGSFTSATIGPSGNQAAPAEAPVIRWDGRENETMVCTISVFRVLSGAGATYPAGTTAGSEYTYRPYFRVMWGGSRGAPNEVLGDIGRGQQFTLAANYLYVNVGMGATSPNNGGNTYAPGSMVLGATFGFFSGARQSQVYYTMYADFVTASGGTVSITIPQFATTIESVTVTTPADWTVTIRNTASSALSNAISVSNLQTRGNAYALPDEAYSLLITNNGGSAASAKIVFGLSL